MARTDILSILYAKKKSIKEFDWNSLIAPPMLSILSMYDINLIESITRDPLLISEPKKKKQYIEDILKPRGLVRFAAGTNRVVYKYLEDQSILFKIATSEPGIEDCRKELYNQQFLKPFVAKCYEVSPGGSIGMFERVETINNYEQYLAIAEDHFNLLDHIFGSGKYIMEDVGSKFWRNIGIRTGFGVVLVDYPMLFELDGNKLFCSNKNKFTGMPCGGEIDVDEGYNHLFCRKCGMQYMGSTLAKKIKNHEIILVGKEENTMKMILSYNGEKVVRDSQDSAKTYLDDTRNKKPEKIKVNKTGIMKVNNNWKHVQEERAKKEAIEEVQEAPVEEVVDNNEEVKEEKKVYTSKIVYAKPKALSIDISNTGTVKVSKSAITLPKSIVETVKEEKVEDTVVDEVVEEKEPKVEEVPKSTMFGTPDIDYDQDYPNYNKMNRRERRKNDKKHKGKGKNKKFRDNYNDYIEDEKPKRTLPMHSPVPRKGLNNMQYNIEEPEVKNVNINKLTHF